MQTVEEILGGLGLADRPRITVLNKIDALLDESQPWDEAAALAFLAGRGLPQEGRSVFVSATKKWGLTALLAEIGENIAG